MLTSMLLGHDRKNTFLNVDTKLYEKSANHTRCFFISQAADGSDRLRCMRNRVSIMVCLISIGCVTSYGKNSNLTSFNESNSVFFCNE